MKIIYWSLKFTFLILFCKASFALTFTLPRDGNIIGKTQMATVQPNDTLSTIGQRHGIGGYEMMEANPHVSFSNPKPGTRLLIPSQFILPDAPRKGIVINLSEMRLYFYHPDNIHVSTFPVGVGQAGWNTPMGKTQITRKRKDPTWIVPDSIMENHLEHGKTLSKIIPPGPTNPLGQYALNLGLESIVIHGTPFPRGVGIRSSHGCIRMLNADVKVLYDNVSVGTPVNILHQTVKIGRTNDQLFLEAHEPLSDSPLHTYYQNIDKLIRKIVGPKRHHIYWNEIERLQSSADGYPQPIGAIF